MLGTNLQRIFYNVSQSLVKINICSAFSSSNIPNNLNSQKMVGQSISKFEVDSKQQIKDIINKDLPSLKQSEYQQQRKAVAYKKNLSQKDEVSIFKQINDGQKMYKRLQQLTPQNFISILSNPQLYKHPQNALGFNHVLTFMRKNKITRVYETQYFNNCIQFITQNINELTQPEDISAFAFNLFKIKYKELAPYQKIENILMEKAEQFSVTCLANITFSLTYIARKQNLHDFTTLFRHLETILAIKLREPNKVNEKDAMQIFVAYSKTQNLSKEFLYVMEQTFLNIYPSLRPREISDMIYTFSLNDYKSFQLIEKTVQSLLDNKEKFNLQELSHIAVACSKFEVMNAEFLKVLREEFMNKQDQVNIQDAGDLFMIFAKNKKFDVELMETFRKAYRLLRANIEYYSLRKFLTNSAELLNEGVLPHRFFKQMMKTLNILYHKNEIKGRVVDELKAEAVKIKHIHFRELFLNILRGKVKLEQEKDDDNYNSDDEQKGNKRKKKLKLSRVSLMRKMRFSGRAGKIHQRKRMKRGKKV